MADVALEHPGDEVDLEVALVHAVRLAHEVAEDALESCRGRVPLLTALVGLLFQLEGQNQFLVKIHLTVHISGSFPAEICYSDKKMYVVATVPCLCRACPQFLIPSGFQSWTGCLQMRAGPEGP